MKGLDVAKYQLDIDWAQVAAAGYEWAAFKATLGTKVVDPKFAQNRAGAEAAGIRYRLAYHWITPNESPVGRAGCGPRDSQPTCRRNPSVQRHPAASLGAA